MTTPNIRQILAADDDHDRAARQVIRAYGKRAAEADPLILARLDALRGELEQVIAEAAAALRAQGYSWRDLGRALGVSHVAVMKRFGPVRPDRACAYCGAPAAHSDHVVPRSRGGSDGPPNKVWACWRCNAQKSSKTLGEWKAWRARQGMPWPPDWKIANGDPRWWRHPLRKLPATWGNMHRPLVKPY